MKKKRRLLQSDTGWCLLAGLLVLLQFWWLPGDDGSVADSYSTTVDGQLGLYRTLSRLLPEVRRESLRLIPEQGAALLIIGPERYPTEAEQEELFRFVYLGGRLLIAPNWSDPDFSLESLGIRFVDRSGLMASDVSASAASALTPPGPTSPPPSASPAGNPSGSSPGNPTVGAAPPAPAELELWSVPVTAESPLMNSSVSFRSTAGIVISEMYAPESLLVSGEGVEAATWRMGSGRVVVCSSPDIFSNRTLLDRESLRLAVRLVEQCAAHDPGDSSAAAGSPVVICEFLNASDAWRETGVLFSPRMRTGSLQLILVAVLAIWLGFHRFGPAIEETNSQRRSLTESAEAVGNLQYRLRDGGAIIRSYLEYLRNQLRRRYGPLLRLEDAAAIASRAGMEPEEVAARLHEAKTLSESNQLSSARAAAMLRWLAVLHDRLCGSRTERTGRTSVQLKS